jgi:hypothetical protein
VSEEWREIERYPAYRVSSLGRIQSRLHKSSRTPGFLPDGVWKDLTPSPNAKGYLAIALADGINKPKTYRIHRLVARAFHGAPPEGKPCVRHRDSNPQNNEATNLRWGSYKENEDDKRENGTWDQRYGGARLTKEDVAEIRSLAGAGVRQIELAKRYQVSRPTITRIVNMSIWRNI